MSRTTPKGLGSPLLTGVALACAGWLAASLPAHADKVGVAAAVHPDAFSSLNGSAQSQVNLGKSIFFNERINTTSAGLVQVLLVDGSTFTVGPGSDLVIDKFVYDPNKGKGEVVASFGKGVMRFVGGKISKNDGGVTVNTPEGALSIRGGMFQGKIDKSGTVFSFLFGEYLKLGDQKIFTPGYSFYFTRGGGATIEPTRPEDTAFIMGKLSGSGKIYVVSGDGPKPWSGGFFQHHISTAEITQEGQQTLIQGNIQNEAQNHENPPPPPPPPCNGDTAGCGPPPPPPCDNPDGCGPPPCDNPDGCGPPPPPPPPPPPEQVQVRVLTGPGLATAFAESPDAFNWGFEVHDSRLTADITGVNTGSGALPETKIDLPWIPDGCDNGPCQVTDATVTQNGQTETYQGIAVFKPGFYAYQLNNAPNGTPGELTHVNPSDSGSNPLLIAGGDAYAFNTPSGKTYTFSLTGDINQPGAAGPFALAHSSPSGPGYQSPLVLLEKDSGSSDDPSRAVWLQASFNVTGTGPGQQSFVNVAVGEWSPESGLSGVRRGSSDVGDTYSFSGEIASLANSDGSHFMGDDNPNLVIGSDSTDTQIAGRNPWNDQAQQAAEEASDTTYHIGIGSGPSTGATQSYSGTFNGFAAGLVEGTSHDAPTVVTNVSSNDVIIGFDPTRNTMTAAIQVSDNGFLHSVSYDLKFGNENGTSAYIDNQTYAAVEGAGSSVTERALWLNRTDAKALVQGYVIGADTIHANEVLFPGQTVQVGDQLVQKRAFCQTCDFMKWGTWGALVTYKTSQVQRTDNVHMGWWIAGDITSSSDMPRDGSATYAGDAIGNVAVRTDGGWQKYVATGDMDMTWNFARRSGTLDISNFDGKSFGGAMFAPGQPQSFSGVLAGKGGVSGLANGAFVNGNGINAAGVIGNFNAGNNAWRATGIFGGVRP